MIDTKFDSWEKVILYLKDKNITTLVIKYEGSGDSGAIECCEYYNENDDEFSYKEIGLTISEDNEIQELAYPMLEDIEDWYNNEGGYGRLSINLSDFTYDIENNIRITDIETYNHNGELKDYIEN